MKLKQYKEEVSQAKLRDLPYILSKIEHKIYDLIKLGEPDVYSSSKYERLIKKRNIVRTILLHRLSEWDKNKKTEPVITYAEIIEQEKNKKLLEEQKEEAIDG